jgi:hypothetical protein
MKVSSVILVAAAAVAAGIGALHLYDTLRVGATAVAPTASAVPESQTPRDGAAEPADKTAQHAFEIERALAADDPQQRETAFNALLPELLAVDPDAVVAMVSRQPAGDARAALLEAVTRRWISLDREAAIQWLDTLEEPERHAAALVAIRTLAAASPAQAIEVADHFGVGHDDGSSAPVEPAGAAPEPEPEPELEAEPVPVPVPEPEPVPVP